MIKVWFIAECKIVLTTLNDFRLVTELRLLDAYILILKWAKTNRFALLSVGVVSTVFRKKDD